MSDDLLYKLNCLIHELEAELRLARVCRDQLIKNRKEAEKLLRRKPKFDPSSPELRELLDEFERR